MDCKNLLSKMSKEELAELKLEIENLEDGTKQLKQEIEHLENDLSDFNYQPELEKYKLWEVTLSGKAYVLAADEKSAKENAFLGELDEQNVDTAKEITSSKLPKMHDLNTAPLKGAYYDFYEYSDFKNHFKDKEEYLETKAKLDELKRQLKNLKKRK